MFHLINFIHFKRINVPKKQIFQKRSNWLSICRQPPVPLINVEEIFQTSNTSEISRTGSNGILAIDLQLNQITEIGDLW